MTLPAVREGLAAVRPTPQAFVGPKLKLKDVYAEKRIDNGAYVARFPGADASVVKRSELYRCVARAGRADVQRSCGACAALEA